MQTPFSKYTAAFDAVYAEINGKRGGNILALHDVINDVLDSVAVTRDWEQAAAQLDAIRALLREQLAADVGDDVDHEEAGWPDDDEEDFVEENEWPVNRSYDRV